MKKSLFLTFVFSLLLFTAKAQYSSQNISLLSHWFNPAETAEPQLDIKYNGVWGWVDVYDGKEYAIIGSGSGTYIIEVSDPTAPVVRDFVPGRRDQCIWREYKTYGNYLYASSDDASPNSFQIMDLSYLPDSVHVVHDDVTIFERTHTLFIDGDKLYCGSVTLPNGSGYYSMAVYSLANPESPTLLRTLNQDDSTINFAHDMFVRNDTVYASCGYQGLFIYKFNTDTTFSLINSITSYPGQGYNHSSFLTPDGKTLVFCDEVPSNTPVKIADVSDMQNISIASTFKSHEGATPHNPYVYGNNRLVVAYYKDGVQIYDIHNPSSPSLRGYFDTDTLDGAEHNYNAVGTAYHGCWGVYTDLPSGVLLASDMQNGLFVLNADLALGIKDKSKNTVNVTVYPNPTDNSTSVSLQLKNADQISIEVFDVTGRKLMSRKESVMAGTAIKTIQTESLAPGMYILKVTGKEINYSQQLVKK